MVRLADWRASAKPRSTGDDPHLPAGYREADSGGESGPVAAPTAALATETETETAAKTEGPHPGERFTGLHTHPLTGWFSAVALLAAAHEQGDETARIRWEPLGTGDAPSIPALHSRLGSEEIVSSILRSHEWQNTEDLLHEHGFESGLGVKNQRLRPANRLRDLLLHADGGSDGLRNPLLLGIVGDLARSSRTAAARQVDLPIAAIHNNASYPATALRALPDSPAELTRAVRETCDALVSVNAGYGVEKCDGGMDRSRSALPGVTGLGDAKNRQTRTALAPLALFGMSRLGSGTPSGIGASGSGVQARLVLPCPTGWTSFEEIQALALIGRGPKQRTRAWERHGQEWVYEASGFKPSEKQTVWEGRIAPRRLP
ncbi:MAG: hypothetical protein ACK5LO_11785 [Leucobacter sp.]